MTVLAQSREQSQSEGRRPRRLLFVINDPAFFLSHRRPIALGARDAGYEVHVASPRAEGPVSEIHSLGLTHHPIPLDRSSRNPISELRALAALTELMHHLRPDIVHNVTIKPVIWGGLAARIARVPAAASAISGLGYVFISEGWRARARRSVLVPLYRMALGGPKRRVIFQNHADRDTFARLGIRLDGQTELIRGSGVDRGTLLPAPEAEGPPVVLMPSRILIDKGAGEFVAAARRLRSRGLNARFILAGDPDPRNPASVPPAALAQWRAEGVVEFPGHCSDIAGLMRAAQLVVLPSYREGLPKALIEAAACGRAVVTTDTPGCRDAIIPGVTGLLVPVRNATALAEAIAALLADPIRRVAMGVAGRKLAEEAFCVQAVVAQHLRIYDELAAGG
jgi:glycosyltransferase involved in cell wall biosynthesis